MQFRGPELLKKRRHYFKKNLTYLVSLCFNGQVCHTIVDRWPQCEWNFNVFADMILPYGSNCLDMKASPEPINGVTGTWLSCFATCHWLRALVTCIVTSDHNFDDQNMVILPIVGFDLPCLRKKIYHQNTMIMSWKVCNLKMKTWTFSAGTILLEIVPPML